jgi:hypothetical protein
VAGVSDSAAVVAADPAVVTYAAAVVTYARSDEQQIRRASRKPWRW